MDIEAAKQAIARVRDSALGPKSADELAKHLEDAMTAVSTAEGKADGWRSALEDYRENARTTHAHAQAMRNRVQERLNAVTRQGDDLARQLSTWTEAALKRLDKVVQVEKEAASATIAARNELETDRRQWADEVATLESLLDAAEQRANDMESLLVRIQAVPGGKDVIADAEREGAMRNG